MSFADGHAPQKDINQQAQAESVETVEQVDVDLSTLSGSPQTNFNQSVSRSLANQLQRTQSVTARQDMLLKLNRKVGNKAVGQILQRAKANNAAASSIPANNPSEVVRIADLDGAADQELKKVLAEEDAATTPEMPNPEKPKPSIEEVAPLPKQNLTPPPAQKAATAKSEAPAKLIKSGTKKEKLAPKTPKFVVSKALTLATQAKNKSGEVKVLGKEEKAAVIQRTCAPAPLPKAVAPAQDPAFNQVKNKAKQVATQEKAHEPAASKAADAQNAAAGPANDISSQAAAAQVGELGEQEPGTFNKQAFISALHQAIQSATPQTQEQVSEFKQSGKAGEVKTRVEGIVKDNKENSEKDIKETNEAQPDTGKAQPKEVKPMQPEQPGDAPGSVGAANAMPKPKSEKEVSLEAGPCEVNGKMAEAKVTEEQLRKSNEPDFNKALDSKKNLEEQSAKAPKEFRSQEQAVLGEAKNEAEAKSGQTLDQMHQGKVGVLNEVGTNKEATKSQDETKRKEVADHIEGIYNDTKTEVTKILDDMDGKVNNAFDNGEKEARQAFENHVETETKKFNDKRYSGPLGWGQWAIDKLTSPPPELNQIYQAGRTLYLSKMDKVIDRVADVVGEELTRAKTRIGKGLLEVKKYVAGLPKDLQEVGNEAQEKIQGKFDELKEKVDAKQEALVESLAQKYVEARKGVDDRIAKMQEENKGLLDRAKEAVSGVIDTIINLKNMLMGVLAKAAGVIDKIIQDPIGFLSNLVNAVGQGLKGFKDNIGKHLQNGLMGWLFGALGDAGIKMPESLDFKGILGLVLQVMGLTYANIRDRAVKIVGEKVVTQVEKTASIFKTLITEGPGGIWKYIQDQISNLPDMILGAIKDFIINKVIIAGITWIVSLLNPASAFIKACKAIYDIVMFFIERGSQIMELVNAILDSLGAIASGSIGAAATAVENALARALPVAISFMASLLGLGGISDKIKKVIQSVQNPVNRAIDTVIKGVLSKFKGLTAKARKGKEWVDGKIKQGKEWVNGKVEQGKSWIEDKAKKETDWAKGKLGIGKGKDNKDNQQNSDGKKQKDLDKALEQSYTLITKPEITKEKVEQQLPVIKSKYNLAKLALVVEGQTQAGETVHVEGEIQRDRTSSSKLNYMRKKKLSVKKKSSIKGKFFTRPEWYEANKLQKLKSRKHDGELRHLMTKSEKKLKDLTVQARSAILENPEKYVGKFLTKEQRDGIKRNYWPTYLLFGTMVEYWVAEQLNGKNTVITYIGGPSAPDFVIKNPYQKNSFLPFDITTEKQAPTKEGKYGHYTLAITYKSLSSSEKRKVYLACYAKKNKTPKVI